PADHGSPSPSKGGRAGAEHAGETRPSRFASQCRTTAVAWLNRSSFAGAPLWWYAAGGFRGGDLGGWSTDVGFPSAAATPPPAGGTVAGSVGGARRAEHSGLV